MHIYSVITNFENQNQQRNLRNFARLHNTQWSSDHKQIRNNNVAIKNAYFMSLPLVSFDCCYTALSALKIKELTVSATHLTRMQLNIRRKVGNYGVTDFIVKLLCQYLELSNFITKTSLIEVSCQNLASKIHCFQTSVQTCFQTCLSVMLSCCHSAVTWLSNWQFNSQTWLSIFILL